MSYYKLDENKEVKSCSKEEWNDFCGFLSDLTPESITKYAQAKQRRLVNETTVNDFEVITLFYGVDNAIFETIVTGYLGPNLYELPSLTWSEAEETHQKAILWVKNGCKDE